MFDISTILKHFKLADGCLYRRLLDGSHKLVSRKVRGQVVAVCEGQLFASSDVIWALTYGRWPKWPLKTLPGNPYSLDNILPQRLATWRFSVQEVNGQFHHTHSSVGYPTLKACKDSWNELYRLYLLADLPYVLAVEKTEYDLHMASNPKYEAPEILPGRTRAKPKERPAKPAHIKGMRWHWYTGKWISVPTAIHVSDDYMLRCEALGKTARFDPELQQTVRD